MFREHTSHPINHTCYRKPEDPPVPINLGTVQVGCVMPPMGSRLKPNCNVCCATDITVCDCDGDNQQTVILGQRCPDGSMPIDVWLAKHDPFYEPIFGCYEYHEIAAILDRYLCYHVCGCSARRSVLLAAAHFTQLHTIINPQTIRAWGRQATKPSSVLSPFPDAIIKAKNGEKHWNLTTYGMEYNEAIKPARALAGLAWGA